MPWLGYPNQLTDFWRPDDGRNRTCFIAAATISNDERAGVRFQNLQILYQGLKICLN
jgi:hypothetical protein